MFDMDSSALAIFSGTAWRLLCLLPDFWTLPGAGEGVGATEFGVAAGAIVTGAPEDGVEALSES